MSDNLDDNNDNNDQDNEEGGLDEEESKELKLISGGDKKEEFKISSDDAKLSQFITTILKGKFKHIKKPF